MVYGFGERKTPRPFITACDKFVYFDVLGSSNGQGEATQSASPRAAVPRKANEESPLTHPAIVMIAKAITAAADEDGWANLARVGAHLSKQSADFDARNYGFVRLSDLVETSDIAEVARVGDHPKVVMVRLKKSAAVFLSRA